MSSTKSKMVTPQQIEAQELKRDRAWGRAALDSQCEGLYQAFKNEPNNPKNRNKLSAVALKLFSVVHGGSIDSTEVRERLIRIGQVAELDQGACNRILDWADGKAVSSPKSRERLAFVSHADRKILVKTWYEIAVNDPDTTPQQVRMYHTIASLVFKIGKTKFDMSHLQLAELSNIKFPTVSRNLKKMSNYIKMVESTNIYVNKASVWQLCISDKDLVNPLSFGPELETTNNLDLISDAFRTRLLELDKGGEQQAPPLVSLWGTRLKYDLINPLNPDSIPTLGSPFVTKGDVALVDPTHNLWGPRGYVRASEIYRLLAVTGEGYNNNKLTGELNISCKKTTRANVNFLRDLGLIEKREGDHSWFATDKILNEQTDGIPDHLAEVKTQNEQKRDQLKAYLSDPKVAQKSAERRAEHVKALKSLKPGTQVGFTKGNS